MAKGKDTSDKEKMVHDGPAAIILEFKTSTGEVWGQITAPSKEFSTGSLGYYANGKVIDPKTGARYQVGCNIILIGSKK